MARTLLVEVVTPSELVYKGEVEMVIATTTEGEVGILPLHAPLVAELATGELRLKLGSADKTVTFAVIGGYLQVADDRMIVLTNNAINAADVKVDEMKSSIERLTDRLKGLGSDEPSSEKESIEQEIEWLENCCNVAVRQEK